MNIKKISKLKVKKEVEAIKIIDFREQFFRVSNEIFEKELNIYEIAVYTLLCRYANNANKMAYPSLKTMSRILKIGKSKLIRTLNNLILKVIIHKNSGDRLKSNQYFLLNINKKPNIKTKQGSPPGEPGVVPRGNQGSPPREPGVVPREDSKKTYLKRLNYKNIDIYYPSLLETKEYIQSNDLQVDYNDFYNYYQSNGWMIGKVKMKSWKAAIDIWHKRNNKQMTKSKKLTKNEIETIKYMELNGVDMKTAIRKLRSIKT